MHNSGPKIHLKSLFTFITFASKFTLKQIKNCNNAGSLFSCISRFWIIFNNQPVFNANKTLNNFNRGTLMFLVFTVITICDKYIVFFSLISLPKIFDDLGATRIFL